jgi:hypothetical protein
MDVKKRRAFVIDEWVGDKTAIEAYGLTGQAGADTYLWSIG